jgi:hypothetical protein
LEGQLIPKNLVLLHSGEETLRLKASDMIATNSDLIFHLEITQQAMDLADTLRQFETTDEDLKVIQILGMRIFNAFAASIKLTLSGYHQNSAMILRDVLETVFLLDLFRTDRSKISTWRQTDDKTRKKIFGPVEVRKSLDSRDGFTTKKRAERYNLFSELAGHPSMKSDYMLRPQKDGNAVIGPFIEFTSLQAVLSEMARLAIEAANCLDEFFPKNWTKTKEVRQIYINERTRWIAKFYSK